MIEKHVATKRRTKLKQLELQRQRSNNLLKSYISPSGHQRAGEETEEDKKIIKNCLFDSQVSLVNT